MSDVEIARAKVQLWERWGRPQAVDRDAALRRLGLRVRVHPDDVCATRHTSPEMAEAYVRADLSWYGHPELGRFADELGGIVTVVDLRPALAAEGVAATDPGWADGPRRFQGPSVT